MGLSGVVVGIAIGNHQSASLSGALVSVAVGSDLGPVKILGGHEESRPTVQFLLVSGCLCTDIIKNSCLYIESKIKNLVLTILDEVHFLGPVWVRSRF